ncbi:MAG: hypothetical protein IV108_00580 [Burkholderiales bacterium]|nr:hypothetical protein [Burkholderiales bacterium]
MSNASSATPSTVEPTADPQSWPLWVVEGIIDFPVKLPVNSTGSPVAQLVLSLGGEDPDGFMQLRPHDRDRLVQASWWSTTERWAYDCRGLVRAPDAFAALTRGSELYEHVADRLTLWSGYPVQVLGVRFTYNENMLRRCAAGELTEYDSTTGGDYTFRVNPPKNLNNAALFTPPPVALEAIRWLRHAMLASRTLDQFLFYYIALESIAKYVPSVVRGPRRDAQGNETEGLESQEAAAIKHLLQRRGLTPDGRRVLAEIRARIAHGNTDWATILVAHNNMATVQLLAADGIALVYGIDPATLLIMQPSPVLTLAPELSAQYSAQDNPTVSWGGLLE